MWRRINLRTEFSLGELGRSTDVIMLMDQIGDLVEAAGGFDVEVDIVGVEEL